MGDRISNIDEIYLDESEDLGEGDTMALFSDLMDDPEPYIRPDEDDEHYDPRQDGSAQVAAMKGVEPDTSDQ